MATALIVELADGKLTKARRGHGPEQSSKQDSHPLAGIDLDDIGAVAGANRWRDSTALSSLAG
jgi:hypothetical protein